MQAALNSGVKPRKLQRLKGAAAGAGAGATAPGATRAGAAGAGATGIWAHKRGARPAEIASPRPKAILFFMVPFPLFQPGDLGPGHPAPLAHSPGVPLGQAGNNVLCDPESLFP